ncbi:hypothetical protein LA080_012280 [Diaporthe eres]|nr:hypothetical protein LA080_012280 [Diaporthe eres]
MASRLVRSGLALSTDFVEASNLRIKGHLPAAHAGLSAIGSGIWTDALLLTLIVRVPYSTLVTPWWILLTIVITSQERSRDTEPERPTLSGPRAAQSFALQHGPSRPTMYVLEILPAVMYIR